jgi:hypothetical protein
MRRQDEVWYWATDNKSCAQKHTHIFLVQVCFCYLGLIR